MSEHRVLWEDEDAVECIAHSVAATSTRDAVAMLTVCRAYRRILERLGIHFLHLRREGAPGIRLPLQIEWKTFFNHSGMALGTRYVCRGSAPFPTSRKIFLPDDIVFQRGRMAQFMVSNLLSNRFPHTAEMIAQFTGSNDEVWHSTSILDSYFENNHTVARLQEALKCSAHAVQKLSDVGVATHLRCTTGFVARFTWRLSFSYRHHREKPPGPRDNNEFDDYIELSNIQLTHANLLLTSTLQALPQRQRL